MRPVRLKVRLVALAMILVLGACSSAGDWIPSQHQTTLRLVVYTSFVWSR